MLPIPLTDLLVVQYMNYLTWQVLQEKISAAVFESCHEMFSQHAWWLWSSGGDA